MPRTHSLKGRTGREWWGIVVGDILRRMVSSWDTLLCVWLNSWLHPGNHVPTFDGSNEKLILRRACETVTALASPTRTPLTTSCSNSARLAHILQHLNDNVLELVATRVVCVAPDIGMQSSRPVFLFADFLRWDNEDNHKCEHECLLHQL